MQTDKDYCEDCVRSQGQSWVHLRFMFDLRACRLLRLVHESTRKQSIIRKPAHPLVRSIPSLAEHWVWCYEDKIVAGEIDQW